MAYNPNCSLSEKGGEWSEFDEYSNKTAVNRKQVNEENEDDEEPVSDKEIIFELNQEVNSEISKIKTFDDSHFKKAINTLMKLEKMGLPDSTLRMANLVLRFRESISDWNVVYTYEEYGPLIQGLIAKNTQHKDATRRSMMYLEKAIEEYNPYAYYYIGELYLDEQTRYYDIKEAIQWFTDGSNNKDPQSMFKLAQMYETGEFLETNLNEAIRLYLESAELGFLPSEYKVATLIEDGTITSKNMTVAIKYYIKNALAGNKESAYRLHRIYEEGKTVKQSKELSLYWLCVAANNGDSDACHQVVVSHYIEKHEIDEEFQNQLIPWLKKSAEDGFDDAKVILGKKFLTADGVGQSVSHASMLLRSAAKSGNKEAISLCKKFSFKY